MLGVLGPSAVVGTGTAANRLAGLPLSSVAATPRAVEEGRVWLLLTSGLLADDPWLPSLLGFAIVLTVALWLLSPPLVATVAASGQIVSAFAVYGVIAVTRVVEPHAFASVVGLDDYGVSAMIAAWIGAVASVEWSRHPSWRGRCLVAGSCLGCLEIGLACRPDLTFLDSEHLVAFAVGAALATSRARALAWRARPVAAAAAAAAAAIVHR